MPTPKTFDNPAYYINRELSWLSFNERVLEEALDDTNPLFERLKFLAITSSNLDEFFMVRVAGLKELVNSKSNAVDSKTGMSAFEQWIEVLEKSRKFMNQQGQVWNEVLLPLLHQAGFPIVTTKDLNRDQKDYLSDLFTRMIYPVLTPMAVDASRPFPMLLNGSLNLAVLIETDEPEKEEYLFAFVQVPSVLPRIVALPTLDGQRTYIFLEDVIRMHLSDLFRGRRILSASCFRITRDSDLALNEDAAEDLLEEIERELNKRKTGDVVRIEVERGIHPFLVDVLSDWEEVSVQEVFELDCPIDLTYLFRFVNESNADLYRFPEFSAIQPCEFDEDQDIFDTIRAEDILLYHPYQSFEPVVRFVHQAAHDPNVLAIKQTLYRVGGDSPIVSALAEAAENGKQVTVLVELRARFDEEKNIVWAKKLEKAGCHVIYGLVGLKTHAKMALVVRLEKDRLQRYVHLGTGNYNDNTARLYTDFGLFTCNDGIAEDVTSVFNQLSGYSSLPRLHHLRVAPWNLEAAFLSELAEVSARSTLEHRGRVIAKMNSLTDKHIIQALYKASQAGVQIDLIVRGICCLRPGIPGVSENIRVHSIVGRFLEHGRAYYFHSWGRRRVFLSSADWMTRNLEMRVETMFPILQPKLKKRVIDILETQLTDNVKRRELQSDGTYRHVAVVEGEERIDSQQIQYQVVAAQKRRQYLKPLNVKEHDHA
ncbi:RNA degradosome polyphosphate kinase [Alicyclobacillus ferrooxydans]|uniref:Polyphosphate kinase n=1 Tax=Alicyclobacillus ferrooxydans TaxID=471514 RepID=A0A0P9EMG3_9BACL|nr:RNA degradosome polyphosphate kinase [Alicyclobacillus ferrooxydans]KPV44548.1 polyphosphate kinase [Alicyclobacillus ferrooxydans]